MTEEELKKPAEEEEDRLVKLDLEKWKRAKFKRFRKRILYYVGFTFLMGGFGYGAFIAITDPPAFLRPGHGKASGFSVFMASRRISKICEDDAECIKKLGAVLDSCEFQHIFLDENGEKVGDQEAYAACISDGFPDAAKFKGYRSWNR